MIRHYHLYIYTVYMLSLYRIYTVLYFIKLHVKPFLYTLSQQKNHSFEWLLLLFMFLLLSLQREMCFKYFSYGLFFILNTKPVIGGR